MSIFTDKQSGSQWTQQMQQRESTKETLNVDGKVNENVTTTIPEASTQLPTEQTGFEKVVNDAQGDAIPTPVEVVNAGMKIEKKVEDGFCCVISMHDGVILFTSPTITDSLGFPKDMWLGRSFIDFVHPKDRSTFASQITTGVAVPLAEAKREAKPKQVENSLYVMLRRYRGLKSTGYGITNKAVCYEPFKLVLSFKEAPEDASATCLKDVGPNSTSILLVICATPVKSVYKCKYNVFIISL